jgi:hypothetical protein
MNTVTISAYEIIGKKIRVSFITPDDFDSDDIPKKKFEQWLLDNNHKLSWEMNYHDGTPVQITGQMSIHEYWQHSSKESISQDLQEFLTLKSSL